MIADNMPLVRLDGLSTRAYNILRMEGWETVGDVRRGWRPNEWLRLPGCGKVTRQEIERFFDLEPH